MLAFAQKPTATRQPASAKAPASPEAKRNDDSEPRPAAPLVAGMRRQHSCPCGGGCPKCRNGQATVPPHVHAVLAEPGHPLDLATQSFAQSRLGHDFSQVRVHTDTRAGESAQALDAVAYTVGRHVVFGTGQFDPRTSGGQRLLAHELTHVLQQSSVTTAPANLPVDPADSPHEREAHQSADRFSQPSPWSENHRVSVTPSGPRLQMQRRGAAGGCGICMGGDFRKLGTVAHREIQGAFVAMDPDIVPEFQVPVVEEDFNAPFVPKVDLTKETQNFYGKVIEIGEIKPLDDAGKQVGIARRKLDDYTRELRFTNDEVFRMRIPPPSELLYVNSQNPPGCPPQIIHVQLTEPGIYQYYCEPPFSTLVRLPQCECGRRRRQKKQERAYAFKEASKPVAKETSKPAVKQASNRLYVKDCHPNFQDIADRVPYMQAPADLDFIIVIDSGVFKQRIDQAGRDQLERTKRLMRPADPRSLPFIQVEPMIVASSYVAGAIDLAALIVIAIPAAPEVAATAVVPEMTAAVGTTTAVGTTVGTGAAVTSTIEAPAGIAAAVSAGATESSSTAATAAMISGTGMGWAATRLSQSAAAAIVTRLVAGGVSEANAAAAVQPLIGKRILGVADVTGRPDLINAKAGREIVIDGQTFNAIVWLTSRGF
ncbi:MAG: DUF4157 domain-containing protein [Bryobacteraceae bacterium]